MFNNNEYTEAKDEQEFHAARKKTTIEKEVESHLVQAHEVVTHLPPTPTVQAYIPQALSGAIFCGHLVTDLDSIAGAIGAAELYGGVPARASEVNSETAFALQEWGVEKPRPIEELLVEMPDAGVCLVDHQQTSQLNKSIDVSLANGIAIYSGCLPFDIIYLFRSTELLVSLITMLCKTLPLSLTCQSTLTFVHGAP